MILELDSLSHQYGSEQALEDVSFGVDAGELLAIVGPSGCGKTTLIQSIAGHVTPTAGTVRLRGETVTTQPPENRAVGIVFQQPTLFPHMTVRENVEYGLAARDIDADHRCELVTEYLELVDLAAQRDSYPAALSGGQKRRVELARALAPKPDLLLLDEPLSALDRALRDQLRDEIARIQRETGVTTVLVTHDQDDAMALADRLAVMRDSSVAGMGTPRALYQSPPNRFVASFLGRSNTLPATVIEGNPLTLAVGEQRLALQQNATGVSTGDTVTCHVRPESLSVTTAPDTGTATLSGEVVRTVDLGRRYDVVVECVADHELVVEHSGTPPEQGSEVPVHLPPDAVTVFDAEY